MLSNLKEFHTQLTESLRENGIAYELKQGGRGSDYLFHLGSSSMVFTVGTEWIGYDLHIISDVVPKNVSIADDTDNYPLDYDNWSLANTVFNTGLSLIQFYFERKIFVGHSRKSLLALPSDNNTYLLREYGRFTVTKKRISEQELADYNLKPHF